MSQSVIQTDSFLTTGKTLPKRVWVQVMDLGLENLPVEYPNRKTEGRGTELAP